MGLSWNTNLDILYIALWYHRWPPEDVLRAAVVVCWNREMPLLMTMAEYTHDMNI